MKLGICYTVFNGIELLGGSIKQIFNQVDEIVIIWQETSNRGIVDNTVKEQIYKQLQQFASTFKITLIAFEPDLKLDTKTNELNKHNAGINVLKQSGCTHFMISATDHYYNEHDFIIAKGKAKDYDLTLTSMFTYYKQPTWQITPMEQYFMPFICKLYPHTEFKKGALGLPYLVDPSVRINTYQKSYLFSVGEIAMHHYSMVRTDIESKFNNAAASSRWGDKAKVFLNEYRNATIDSKIEYFKGNGLKEVPNYFRIHL